MRVRISGAAVIGASLFFGGCGNAPAPAPPAPVPSTVVKDPHSFANSGLPHVIDVNLDLTADFAARTLRGRARLKLEGGGETLVLDTRGLTIRRVSASGNPLPFSLGETKGVLGAPLAVTLKGAADLTVDIEYETAPDAAALQWLAPAQTAGKKLPFLFTQGEAILTRTWIPTQDSPGIRQTYRRDSCARRHAGGDERRARGDRAAKSDAQGLAVYRFKMDKRDSAVPDRARRRRPRRSVRLGRAPASTPSRRSSTRPPREFAEVDQMIAAAEKLYGPYRWGRYDMLVLPPSFPFGGMENPTLTFATPTVLAGDRSLVSLIAHELAHSWSGNLVTNATWNDFWLNEGFTTYIEQPHHGGAARQALRRHARSSSAGRISREAIDDAGGPHGAGHAASPRSDRPRSR